MPPSTVFFALQCCQCSTMQVKQRKKSSNKWTCVVCNQKQSVRKVFAQGYMAKDVRKFVQSFNMSRQFAEQNVIPADDDKETLEIEDKIPPNGKLKRTDWTEYIDPEEEDSEIGENPGDEFELKLVTEMPKPVFKKPKLKSYHVAKDCEYGDEKNILVDVGESLVRTKGSSQAGASSRYRGARVRGTQQERTNYAAEIKGKSADRQEEVKLEEPMHGMFEWRGCLVQGGNVKLSDEVPGRNRSATIKGWRSSKWSCYITEEDDNLLPASGKANKNQANQGCDPNAFETEFVDQRVDEDIHPDFL
ncbi:uncharacterized protein LOC113750269 [Coffea eugenioides]|uniref:uncharacterized protein LOC113750269 n=1 Tax=Coffea eugenioides TaxID=49369 RepID=UPI000F608EC0|nr:uncharacterized protein LOC113750269 [Coffea eugenioides]